MIARTDLSMGWIIIAAVAAIAVIMGVLMKVAMPKFKIMQKLIDRVNLVSANCSRACRSSARSVASSTRRRASMPPTRV